jgi:methylated-DNA-protein-cysteine methyltransferase-like protein
MAKREFTKRVLKLISSIPYGKVASYGQIAGCAGSARAARQVAWLLHSSSDREALPWHRVVNSAGRISLPPERGGDLQRVMLESEAILFEGDTIDLSRFGWVCQDEEPI